MQVGVKMPTGSGLRSPEREAQWDHYEARLEQQVEESLWGESFGLRQVYIPLRGWYTPSKRVPEHPLQRLPVVDLRTALLEWVGREGDSLKLLTGGPGSGKSSFLKMLAADIAAKRVEYRGRVLYLPLHRLNLDCGLVESIETYLHDEDLLTLNPLAIGAEETEILLLFDGLDEVALRGTKGQQAANSFVCSLSVLLNILSSRKVKAKAILAGRGMAVQSHSHFYGDNWRLYYLLPYKLSADFLSGFDGWDLEHDPELRQLLNLDQRQEWWRRYGELKGIPYPGVPDEITGNRVWNEITTQPLLNHLAAISGTPGRCKAVRNSNELYNHLFKAIFERKAQEETETGMSRDRMDDFVLLMETLSVAAWHETDSAMTREAITRRCEEDGLKDLWESLSTNDFKVGSLSLMLTVSARAQPETRDTAFEFTDKSFGEYFVARRVVRQLEKMSSDREAQGQLWREDTALIEWARLCGPAPLDCDLFYLIANEVELKSGASEQPEKNIDLIRGWQALLAHLLGYIVQNGIPMHQLTLQTPGFQSMMEQSRNAEVALLALHHACARVTQQCSDVEWTPHRTRVDQDDRFDPHKMWSTAFGAWLRRIQPQQNGDLEFTLSHLAYLNLQQTSLRFVDLHRADLTMSNLSQAYLSAANLSQAILTGADLRGANLNGANLNGANLNGADLSKTVLKRAVLRYARLVRANLNHADLSNADLTGVDMHEADLSDADLTWANLGAAYLDRSNLQKANLTDADLGMVSLRGADLRDANLTSACMPEADLREADLSGAELRAAYMRSACLLDARLDRAHLQDTDVSRVYITRGQFDTVLIDGQQDLSRVNIVEEDERAGMMGPRWY